MRRRVAAATVLMAIGLVGCSSGPSSSSATSTTAAPATTATTAAPPSTVATTTIPLNATLPTEAPPIGSTATPLPSSAPPAPTTSPSGITTSSSPRVSTTATPGSPPSSDESGPTSSQPPAAPCDAATLLKAADAAFGPLPAGSTIAQPTCVENYASGILMAPGADNAFVVFDNIEGEWEGIGEGTDQVCSGAAIPTQFFGPLNCGPWEG